MQLETWLAFVVTSIILVAIPGPTILTVVSYSISHGRRANLPLIAGVSLGDATALLFSLVGVGSMLTASPWLFDLLKWGGGAYLVFLGVRLLISRESALTAEKTGLPASAWKLFLNTYLVTASNPKCIVFFIAFFPQFLRTDHAVAPQLWILALTFMVLGSTNATLYALFATSARRFLATPRAQRWFNRIGGMLLTSAGLWALLAKKG